MKKLLLIFLSAALLLAATGCAAPGGASQPGSGADPEQSTGAAADTPSPGSAQPGGAADSGSASAPRPVTDVYANAVHIVLSDEAVTVDSAAASRDEDAAVYVGADIVYYEEGHDFTYGEGGEADEHSAREAAEHTVVTITRPGSYLLTGMLSRGQIAVDLGKKADDDPDAVVTLIFGGADVTCTVAPAVIFYNVYECGSDDEDEASPAVDTSAAGANVIIADGTVNNISGSYVARIYKSVELNDAGTEVMDSKKLHKYDGAFYSKMSMNIDGGAEGTGVLNITAENEGLDTELHLTINGGNIKILSGNDGINTNEDDVSVTTVNGGRLEITVSGATGEGDGIDSNGWLVINGGAVIAHACGFSMDAGIDSSKGIHINGGTVMAFGNMLDAIDDSKSTYAVFRFAQSMEGGRALCLKNAAGETVIEWTPANSYSYAVLSCESLVPGDYSLWSGDMQLGHDGGAGGAMGQRPQWGSGMPGQEGAPPQGTTPPDGMTPPQIPDGEQPQIPDSTQPQPPQGGGFGRTPDDGPAQGSGSFSVSEGANHFTGVCPL